MLERRDGVRLAEREPQLAADPRARHPLGVPARDRGRRELGRVRLELEAQPRRVARDPPQPRGVVAEARVVQHAQPRGREVVEGVLGREQLATRQVERDRVDGHVAAAQVLVDRGGPHVRKRPRMQVGLRARGGEVPAAVAVAHGRGPEALMRGGDVAQRRRQRLDLALDDDVELARDAAEQEVAHGPADEVRARHAVGGVEQPTAAIQRAQLLEEIHRHSLAARARSRRSSLRLGRRNGGGARASRRLAPPRSLPWRA